MAITATRGGGGGIVRYTFADRIIEIIVQYRASCNAFAEACVVQGIVEVIVAKERIAQYEIVETLAADHLTDVLVVVSWTVERRRCGACTHGRCCSRALHH